MPNCRTNMRQNFNWLPAALFLLIATVGHAQETEKKDVESINGLVGLQVGIPAGDMRAAIKNNMGDVGFGLGLEVLTNPFTWGKNKRNSCLRIGGEVGYTYYGRFISDVNINGYQGSYKTSYGILQLNGVLQLRPKEPEYITPFLEILVGGNFYLSSIKENLDAIETALGIQGFDMGGYSSASFNKGLAVGCSIGKPRAGQARFTLRISYNRGTDIKYVVRNSIHYNPGNGNLSYDVGHAPVEYVMAQVAVGF